jgi:hypothetical protein
MRGFARHPVPPPPRPALIAWRVARLRDAGFRRELAERLAGDRHHDVHALLELVDRGCPPEMAARMLAPIDDRAETAC